MAIKSILTNQEDFTGEFPVTSRTSALDSVLSSGVK